jgi:CMP-N-acetylneuraminic acid synthetase
LDERNHNVCSERALAYVMDDLSGVDIDREVDFQFAEFLITKGVFVP